VTPDELQQIIAEIAGQLGPVSVGEGFPNPVAGGDGTLVYPNLHSPNFVHGVSGWAINQDGSAEFHSITLPSGGGGMSAYFAGTAPASPNVGDLWYNTANGMQLSQWNGSTWTVYLLSTGAIGLGAIVMGQLASSVTARGLGGITTTISASPPSAGNFAGDVWIDASTGYQLKRWDGSAWVPVAWNASNVIQAGTILVPQLNSSVTARALGGITTTISSVTPLAPVAGDVWIDSSTPGYVMRQYNGSAWTALLLDGTGSIKAATITAASIVANTITAAQIAAGTITAGQIQANTITAAQIAANTITAAQIAANTITAGQIQANTITAGQLAAGIVYAGIVDATTITAATFIGGIFRGTNFLINNTGELYYSGTPALGNLVFSLGNASTDTPGNTVYPGFTSYNPGSTYAANMTGGALALGTYSQLSTADATSAVLNLAGYIAFLGSAGLIGLSSGKTAAADTPARLTLASQNQSGVTGGQINATGRIVVAGETWHAMGAFNANFSHGVPAPAYKLNADATVSLAGAVSVVSGTTSGTVITLPTSTYFPISTKKWAVPISAGTPAAAANVQVTINTSGQIILSAGPTGAAYSFNLDCIRYPLDY
jgi:hypothetical protein